MILKDAVQLKNRPGVRRLTSFSLKRRKLSLDLENPQTRYTGEEIFFFEIDPGEKPASVGRESNARPTVRIAAHPTIRATRSSQ
jgi:hypothetical protein